MADKKRKSKAKTAPGTRAAKAAPVAKVAPVAKAAPPAAQASEVCPRCGTSKFAPEERTRIEGRRTVRYTVLVCERGHTFARAARTRPRT